MGGELTQFTDHEPINYGMNDPEGQLRFYRYLSSLYQEYSICNSNLNKNIQWNEMNKDKIINRAKPMERACLKQGKVGGNKIVWKNSNGKSICGKNKKSNKEKNKKKLSRRV